MNVAVSRKKQQQPSRQCDQLLEFLKSHSSYPHRPLEVRLIETHISWVFIASPFVFKVKKPVNLGFLDFSSLEKRHHFCQRELELNRRLCLRSISGSAPINKSASGYSFKARGQIAEYSVKMKELPDGWFLRQLLARHVVGEKEINRVISRLHRFYEAETPAPRIEEWGKAEKLKINTDENFAQVNRVWERRFHRSLSTRFGISRITSILRTIGYSVSEFGKAEFETVMAICISTMSISHREQQRSSIASSLMIVSASSTSQVTSHFWRWILISNESIN